MSGKVWLVGAGPGDPGLITVKGREALERADVVVYDELVSREFLELAPEGAEVIYVGGQPRLSDLTQDEISQLLVRKAGEGKRVVRLTGGDPFVFGPGDDEAEALRSARVAFEVVDGVTSAVAAPAYAGIPVTQNETSSSFAVVSGRDDPDDPASPLDWSRLATATDTLVLLFASRNLRRLSSLLMDNRRPASTPVAVVSWGTYGRQQTVVGTLASIVDKPEVAEMREPTVTVVGDVVSLRDRLRWYDDRPLFGKRVLVARSRLRSGTLRRLLRDEGAEVVEMPALEVIETTAPEIIGRVISSLAEGSYGWALFVSTNAVELFFRRLRESGRDARAWATKIRAVGVAVAEALARYGIRADVVADEGITGVPEPLAGRSVGRRRVLVPRAEHARPELIAGLRKLGAEVEDIPLYVAAVPRLPNQEALAALRRGEFDIVTFASSFSVSNVVALLDGNLDGLKRATIACAGHTTAQTARELGLRADVVDEAGDLAGLVVALREHFAMTARV